MYLPGTGLMCSAVYWARVCVSLSIPPCWVRAAEVLTPHALWYTCLSYTCLIIHKPYRTHALSHAWLIVHMIYRTHCSSCRSCSAWHGRRLTTSATSRTSAPSTPRGSATEAPSALSCQCCHAYSILYTVLSQYVVSNRCRF